MTIAPVFDSSLDWVRAHTRTPLGRVAVEWQRDEDGIVVKVDIPVGAVATVRLPATMGGTAPDPVGSGHHEFRSDPQ